MRTYEGERLRWGYGVAWRNYEDRSATCFLVPFNIFARWGRDIYLWLAHYTGKMPEANLYLNGYDAGYKAATEYYEIKIKQMNDVWSRTVGLAILDERERYTPSGEGEAQRERLQNDKIGV